jgi:hypothetical protein
MSPGHSRLAGAGEAKQSGGEARRPDCRGAVASGNDEAIAFFRIMR